MQYLHTSTPPDTRLPAVGKILFELQEQYGNRAIEIDWKLQGRLLATVKLDEPWLLLHPTASQTELESGESFLSTGHDYSVLAELQTVVCDHALWAYAYADDAYIRNSYAGNGLKAAQSQSYCFCRLPNIKMQHLGEHAITLLTWLCSLPPQQAVTWADMQRVSQLGQSAVAGLLHALLITGCIKKVADDNPYLNSTPEPAAWTDSMLQWLRLPMSRH